MGRLKHGELSQSSRAIKWRANKTVQNAAYALEKQGATELIIEGDIVSTPKEPKATQPAPDFIGVVSRPEPTVRERETEIQEYHCDNCRAPVHQGDKACGVCEQRLNWAGVV